MCAWLVGGSRQAVRAAGACGGKEVGGQVAAGVVAGCVAGAGGIKKRSMRQALPSSLPRPSMHQGRNGCGFGEKMRRAVSAAIRARAAARFPAKKACFCNR